MKSKILITGGAGFIGHHLCGYLLKDGDCSIDIIDNLSRGKFDRDFSLMIRNKNVKFIKGDLTDYDSFNLLEGKYDYIYHLAAIIGVKNIKDNPVQALYVNTLSVLNLLNWVNKKQRFIKGLLFSSTSEVYAGTLRHYGVKIPTNEQVNLCLEDITSGRTTYALSKLVGESACLNYFNMYKLPAVIVRFHNIYGPRMGYSHVIPELMCKAANSRKFLDVFSPRHTRAFCYVSDAVRSIAALVKEEKTFGRIFNVGNDKEEIAMGKLALRIKDIVNPSLKIRPLGNTPDSPLRRCPDIRELENTINFSPKVHLSEGLKLTWKWYREHLRESYYEIYNRI